MGKENRKLGIDDSKAFKTPADKLHEKLAKFDPIVEGDQLEGIYTKQARQLVKRSRGKLTLLQALREIKSHKEYQIIQIERRIKTLDVLIQENGGDPEQPF